MGAHIRTGAGDDVSGLAVSKRQLRAACAAWESGGCLGLGLWLSRHKEYHTVADYGDLVAMVRAELGDETDYSKAGDERYLGRNDDAATQDDL